ncbi:MAG: DUF4097 family beta strand repeat protein [Acidobacteria bacterium]|nr:DUF4097 family beta strand repeat protein [Acidobacteriota bacterium]
MKQHSKRAAKLVLVVVIAGAVYGAAQTRKEFRYTVSPKSTVYVANQYGPISAKSAPGNQVVVTVVLRSDKVEVEQSQRGNRVEIRSHLLTGADVDSGQADYEITLPSDANVTLQSSTGPLHVEKLNGDVTLEGATAEVDVRDLSGGHVHIKTLNGPVTLTNVRDGHVEITSVSGDVVLNGVEGPLVQVNSTSGKIHYDGNFGFGGQYSLTSHTGDIEALAPPYASIDVTARSVRGQVENDFPLEPKHSSFVAKAGSAFAGTVGKAASSVKLLSFSGKIHLKKR